MLFNRNKPDLELEGTYFLIIKLTNKFMQHGKKTIMERILLQIRVHIKNIWWYFPQKALTWLFDHVKPMFGLSAKRQGKLFNFVPIPLQNNRPVIVSLKWFMQNVKAKSLPRKLHDRIIGEIAYIFFNSRFSMIQRRNAYYAIVYDNRSNMRYRWK
jgi:ribosomal protein S7